MLEIDWWWVLMLLPLPWLARKLLPPAKPTELALSVPLLNQAGVSLQAGASQSRRLARYCLVLFWICLVIAASRPFW